MAQAPDRSPWKTVVWGRRKRTEYIKAIKEFKPIDGSVNKARILLLGPSGVGKSSFVNSVFSIFRGSIGNRADGGKPTSGFRPYLIRGVKEGTFLNLALCDAMGLSEENGAGLHSDDIISIIQGHVPDGYQFSPTSPMTPETDGYVAAPTLNRKIHCVVYVMDASTVSDVSAELQKKLGEIRQRVTSMMKNYVPNELELNNNCDVLLLTAVYEMLRLADNCMDDIATKSVNDITERLGALST
eukprot:XP_011618978.1 PREDICTED: interferon-induced protein 44-like [Takifugu rubripes]